MPISDGVHGNFDNGHAFRSVSLCRCIIVMLEFSVHSWAASVVDMTVCDEFYFHCGSVL
jgi:hypothetical protein